MAAPCGSQAGEALWCSDGHTNEERWLPRALLGGQAPAAVSTRGGHGRATTTNPIPLLR